MPGRSQSEEDSSATQPPRHSTCTPQDLTDTLTEVPQTHSQAMLFKKVKKSNSSFESELRQVIDAAIPDADDETRAIVVAVAGLLGCISYADRDFSKEEKDASQDVLQTIKGITHEHAKGILHALESNIVEISTVEAPRYTRALVQLADRELRLRVLDMLLGIAAADDNISHNEVVLLRHITKSLGLDQDDYNRLQASHRDLLGSLK
jgi:uncharacterized tellurite resistance protein B-like protein